jgi:hypothetical protein
MDWTDRHCRFFHRLMTRRALPRLAHVLPGRSLEIGFGIFLLLVSARFVVSLVG